LKRGIFGRLAMKLPVRFAGPAVLLALGIVLWSACGAAGDGGAPQHVSSGSGGAASSNAADQIKAGTEAAETDSPPSGGRADESESGAAERETQVAASVSADTSSGSGGTPVSRAADNGSSPNAPGASNRDDGGRPQEEGEASSNVGGQAAAPVSEPVLEPEPPSVTLTIRGEGDIGIILENYSIPLTEGDTVLELTKQAARREKIPMEYSGRGALAYVEGINGLYEFDHGPESGWLYYVNGEQPVQGAGVYKPAPGDKVEWVYVLEKKND
jgi:hypothetical protein